MPIQELKIVRAYPDVSVCLQFEAMSENSAEVRQASFNRVSLVSAVNPNPKYLKFLARFQESNS